MCDFSRYCFLLSICIFHLNSVKNATYFCMLTVSCHLLEIVILSFCVESAGLYVYTYIYNRHLVVMTLISSFQFGYFSSLLLPLISVAKISSTMLKEWHAYLYQILARLSAFHHYYVKFGFCQQ